MGGGPGGVLERGAIFEIGLERGAQKKKEVGAGNADFFFITLPIFSQFHYYGDDDDWSSPIAIRNHSVVTACGPASCDRHRGRSKMTSPGKGGREVNKIPRKR